MSKYEAEKMSPEEEWAYLFGTFGKEEIREMLMHVAEGVEEQDRVVIEFLDDYRAMDVTDHYEELEREKGVW